MPEIGEIVQLDNGLTARVVEVDGDSVTVELLDADGNPTGETVEIEVKPPETAPEADNADTPAETEPEPEPEQTAVSDAPPAPDRLRAALDTLAVALGLKSAEPPVSGFKVYGNKWVGWWTNNFKDKQGEIITEKAIDSYIWRADKGLVSMPPLRFLHVAGSEHGRTEFLGREGHYAIAAGTFDDTPLGQRAAEVYARSGKRYAMSHGFVYRNADKQNGVYHQFNTYEISVLPAKAAANPFTQFEEVSTKMDAYKEKALRDFFGEELAASIITNTQNMSKALEDIGVSFKDMTPPVENEDPAAEVQAVKAVEATLGGLINDLTADSAAAVEMAEKSVKMIVSQKSEIDALRAEVKALREAVDLRPRSATTDAATGITKEVLEQKALGKAVLQQITEQQTELDTFWGVRVVKEEK